MKRRNTFVSNSSSTSFVFSVDKDAVKLNYFPVKLTLDLMSYVEDIIETEEELRQKYHNEWMDDPENYDHGRQALEAIRHGKVVCYGSASDQSDPEENMLCNSGIGWLEDEDYPLHVIVSGGGY